MDNIKNISNYLEKTLSKIDGFDYRWYSMITSNPLLFEDIDYYRCKQFVNNTITEEELKAYREGKLREVYHSFETMLMCNLKHYDRIISFCTIAFLGYVRINNEPIKEHLSKVPLEFELTPTRIWCMSMCGITSTEFELNYAWNYRGKKSIIKFAATNEQTLFEANFKHIYKQSILFRRFVEYASYRIGTSGFIQTKINDVTSNKRLNDICSKFTKSSLVSDIDKLKGIQKLIDYHKQNEIDLYNSLNNNLTNMYGNQTDFAVFVFHNEFYLHSKKFKMLISKKKKKDGTQTIHKEYLSNSYECFIAESKLASSIKEQIKWTKSSLPSELKIDENNLITILLNMLNTNYKNVICIKQTPVSNVYSKIYFRGVFNNLYICETMYMGNTIAYESRICMSKENAARYIVERGYYMFGTSDEIIDVLSGKLSLLEHYNTYCIPILKHMEDIQELHYKDNQLIIDILITRKCDENRLSKIDYYTTLKGNKRKFHTIMDNINPDKSTNKISSYYQIINK